MTGPVRWSQQARTDEGRIALLVLVMAIGVLMMIGLAVDGGGRMRAAQRADNVAAEAARAGGQAIELDRAASGGEKLVDPARAVAAAQSYLAAAGVAGTVVLSDDRHALTVTVTTTYHTKILGMVGFDELAVTGEASAQLLTG